MNYLSLGGNHLRTQRDKNQLLILCLGVGFLIGILYENVFSGRNVTTSELFLKGNLQMYLQTDIITNKFLWYVVKERVLFFAVTCLLGCMKWKKLFVILFLLYIGFVMGVLTVAAVLYLGALGLLFIVASILPHYIFYLIGYSILFLYWFRYPSVQWNQTKTICVFFLFLFGIVLEVYANPILVKWVIGFL